MASFVSFSNFFATRNPIPLSYLPASHSFSSNSRRTNALLKSDYSCFEVRDLSYRPPGTEHSLLNAFWVNFWTEWKWENYFIAGLSKPTSGSICVQKYDKDGKPCQSSQPLTPERVGIVFQFPER
ncbi:ABC transporter I family member 11 [Cucumis melo var. makuwa]|uniref:ABC transporter I family member 11 n=1 Tax=Cucumis melo var. makuwa TaxID=1194695 RepID=A0A5A7USP5_CUCMM|nr:ABC transporter I family member 11 [Cucumis melo var. makuwa]